MLGVNLIHLILVHDVFSVDVGFKKNLILFMFVGFRMMYVEDYRF